MSLDSRDIPVRERDPDSDHSEEKRSTKRQRIEEDSPLAPSADVPSIIFPEEEYAQDSLPGAKPADVAKPEGKDVDMTDVPLPSTSQDSEDRSSSILDEHNPLPPSHALLKLPVRPLSDPNATTRQVWEADVGVSEYISAHVSKIDGIIKQRFTDFIVNEVDQDGNVIHIQSIMIPSSSKKDASSDDLAAVDASVAEPTQIQEAFSVGSSVLVKESTDGKNLDAPSSSTPTEWPDNATLSLSSFLSETAVEQLKQMYLEGPEPPFISDGGWAGRIPRTDDASKVLGDEGDEQAVKVTEDTRITPEESGSSRGQKSSGRGRGRRDRGGRGRGGRGEGRGRPREREDSRKVLSDPMSDKALRTKLHTVIRELFGGKFDTETDMSTPSTDDGSRIVIKWGRGAGAGGRGGRGGTRGRPERGDYPPYIHFAMQKTNRDTHDALGHLARLMRVDVKDLSVAGTKDKRGVTTQRVSLRRGSKKVEDVWKLANTIGSRRTMDEAVSQRGERGVRVADFVYRKASLELGMLKGNAFVITLRNVQVDSIDTMNEALTSLKDKGFINYYGMQRFGTAAIPTHSIGLCLLKSEWDTAVNLLLQHRPGEHPEVVAAREAWLVEGDLDKALELMPRRVVAERCILENFKKNKGDSRNSLGALSTIPRNLRLMYVHAYQSYVWNAIVSERVKMFGAEKPVAGDLVFETQVADEDADVNAVPEPAQDGNRGGPGKSRKAWVPPKVKTLTAEDVNSHSIFEVIMPLPGKDVAYPGGPLGERYREFMRADGLDPDNLVRKQKDYSLSGSYRKILQKPGELSWSVLRYTDPDVALAQADEDKLLGFEPPVVDKDGKFMALQIQLTLPTAAYATMALREVTKTDTGSHHQIAMTQVAEDQQYKGTVDQ